MLKKVKFKNFPSFTRGTLIDLNASKIEYLGETNCIDGILKGVSFLERMPLEKQTLFVQFPYYLTFFLKILF